MKCLIIKTSSLGDLIQTFPVVSYLKKKFPQGEVDWVVEKSGEELIASHPHVDRVITLDTRKWRKSFFCSETWKKIRVFCNQLQRKNYDAIFDLQGNCKSSMVLGLSKGKAKMGFGRRAVPEWPNLLFTHTKFSPPPGKNIREDYLFLVQSYFKDTTPYREEELALHLKEDDKKSLETFALKKKKAILVCPYAAWKNKCLPPSTLISFLHRLDREIKGDFLFLAGNAQEKKEAKKLAHLFPQTSRVLFSPSLPLLQQVMRRCFLVLAMDSLPLHLCGTTKTPCVSFFGPSRAQKYAPLIREAVSFQGTCPYQLHFDKRCPHLRTCKTGACMLHFEEKNCIESTLHFVKTFL